MCVINILRADVDNSILVDSEIRKISQLKGESTPHVPSNYQRTPEGRTSNNHKHDQTEEEPDLKDRKTDEQNEQKGQRGTGSYVVIMQEVVMHH